MTDMQILHRPYGVEHPYARSLDQRSPAVAVAGEELIIAARTTAPATAVECVLSLPSGTVRLPMAAVDGADSDAALLAGGDGHLAAAQEAALEADNGWQVVLAATPHETGTYSFVASGADGVVRSQEFSLRPASWTQEPCGRLELDDERLIPGSVRWLRSAAGIHKVRFGIRLASDEHVVGFGERYDWVDQRGHCLDAVVFEQYKSQGQHHRTYLPMPWAMVVSENTGRAWGFHLQTSRRSWYDVAASQDGVLLIEADLDPTTDPALRVATWSGTPQETLNGFLNEVGRATQMPEWVFGLWASGNEWNSQAAVMEQVHRHQSEGIPISAVVIEAWSDEESFTVFRDASYDVGGGQLPAAENLVYPADGAWPDPAGMIHDLHERGIKVLLWQIPLQKAEQSDSALAQAQRDSLLASGHMVSEADGSAYRNRGWWFPGAYLPDLSTAAGRRWWTEQRRYLVEDLGVDGFKTDGGEHAWGHDLCYANGQRGDEANNLFPVHYAAAYGELLRSAGKDPVTFSRSGFAGSQPHGIFWAGDENSTWEAFRSSITAGITAGASGIVYWGWDIGGFSGPVPDAELYMRAFAASALMPIMQYHSEFNHHRRPCRDRTPWNVAEAAGEPQVVEVARRFVALRQQLRPYLASEAQDCVAGGAPLMRALFFDHADDPEIWNHPLQYKLGSKLLVHPVTQPGAKEWQTYLPQGDWEDFWTGERLHGGQMVTTAVDFFTVPVFRRG